MSQESWDERYAAAPVWSGRPNPWLVATAEGLPPGAALDVGCGEGADAIWLADSGWQVTAVDFSAAGLARAAEHADAAGVAVDWVHADLASWQPARRFDLVSVQFFHAPPPLRRQVHRLAWAATAGTLVVVGHDPGHKGGPPAETRYSPRDVLGSLGLAAADPAVAVAEIRHRPRDGAPDAVDAVVVLTR